MNLYQTVCFLLVIFAIIQCVCITRHPLHASVQIRALTAGGLCGAVVVSMPFFIGQPAEIPFFWHWLVPVAVFAASFLCFIIALKPNHPNIHTLASSAAILCGVPVVGFILFTALMLIAFA